MKKIQKDRELREVEVEVETRSSAHALGRCIGAREGLGAGIGRRRMGWLTEIAAVKAGSVHRRAERFAGVTSSMGRSLTARVASFAS